MALYESGGVQGYVYFPTSGIVSLLYVLENGSSAEIAVTGCEGLVGIALFMGGETTPSRAVVQSAGRGYRIKAAALKEKFEAGGALQYLLLRFTQALITQMTQTAVCNRHHAVDQQLCRWLLLSLDRLPANDLVMTQELIANMLGVRREGVTEAAGKLQAAGLIKQPRQDHGPRPAGSQRACASATPWSSRSTTGCCRLTHSRSRTSRRASTVGSGERFAIGDARRQTGTYQSPKDTPTPMVV